jgi:hypothetical protein
MICAAEKTSSLFRLSQEAVSIRGSLLATTDGLLVLVEDDTLCFYNNFCDKVSIPVNNPVSIRACLGLVYVIYNKSIDIISNAQLLTTVDIPHEILDLKPNPEGFPDLFAVLCKNGSLYMCHRNGSKDLVNLSNVTASNHS